MRSRRGFVGTVHESLSVKDTQVASTVEVLLSTRPVLNRVLSQIVHSHAQDTFFSFDVLSRLFAAPRFISMSSMTARRLRDTDWYRLRT